MAAPEVADLPPVILLAGGKSSRMPVAKGLVDVRGEPWIHRQLARLEAAGLRDVVVVLGYRADEYLAQLPWLRQATLIPVLSGRVQVRALVNEFPEWGPFSSIQAGARALAGRDAFVLPIDVPAADAATWRALAQSRGEARVPEYAGRGGHPVLLEAALLARLATMPADAADSRLDTQIRGIATRVPVLDGDVGRNLNTPEEWTDL